MERKILQLEIESTALAHEKDKVSKETRKLVRKEIINLRQELEPLKQKWQTDRGRVEELKSAKQKLKSLQV